MKIRGLLTLLAVVILTGVFFFWTKVSVAQMAPDLDDQVRTLNFSKSVPSLLNYQGFLATADSAAVNETLQMTFRLFDSETKGAELWSETHSAVEVSNGRFYVLLGSVTPFPANLFDGSILYLQMEVGTDVFSPRKAIVSVAYSQRADEAEHAPTADSAAYATDAHHAVHADTAAYSPGTNPWLVSGDDVYRLTGRVGIGTASPSTELEVIGTVDADAYTVNGVPIGTSTDTYWNRTGDDIYYTAGNVGVGTASPTARLHVAGSKGHESSLCSADYAVYGNHSGGNEGYLGSNDYGAYGKYSGNGNEGVLGGELAGVQGSSAGDIGVYGEHSASGNVGWLGADDRGVYGYNANSGNYGLLGGEGTQNYGVYGLTFSAEGGGVYGVSNASGNFGDLGDSDYGVYGQNSNGNWGGIGSTNYGVYGQHSGGNWGLLGASMLGAYGYNSNGNYGSLGEDNYGVYGSHNNGNWGYIGGTVGVRGQHSSGHYGNLGDSNNGVYGQNNNGNMGFLGNTTSGAMGIHSSGHKGELGGSNFGAWGEHASGNSGALGTSGHGVYGSASGGGDVYGVYGTVGNIMGYLAGPDGAVYGQHGTAGNYGYFANSSYGVYGHSDHTAGVYGHHSSGNSGYIGNINHGVYGAHANGNNGYLGGPDAAVKGNAISGYAGYFVGDAYVTNHLSKGTGSFKIDHPLDPENMYLYHSFVESPDMMNIYNGNVVLDAGGQAWVELPQWFGALNRDFRYQLTCIGGFAPVYIEEEISGNRFKIAGGSRGMKVSWQVTGIRQDPLANAHRIPVEEEKPPEERGYYLHPDAYGLSQERNVEWVRDPEMMRRMQEKVEARGVRSEERARPERLPLKIKPRTPLPSEGEKSLQSDIGEMRALAAPTAPREKGPTNDQRKERE